MEIYTKSILLSSISKLKGYKTMNYKEDLRELKQFFGVFTNKELAENLNISESAVKGWNKKESIPRKYEKYINFEMNSNGKTNELNLLDLKLLESIKKLSDNQKKDILIKIQDMIINKNIIQSEDLIIGNRYIIKAKNGINKKHNNKIIELEELEDHFMPNYAYGIDIKTKRRIKIEPLSDMIKL